MKKYRIIAGIFSLCLLLSGCGNSAESSEAESSSKSENTANIAETQANQDDEMEEIRKELEEQGYTPEEIADMLGETVINSGTDGTAAETEAETVNPELFAYYDLLNEEYEKYGYDSGFYALNRTKDVGFGHYKIDYSFSVINSHLLTGFDSENIYTYDTSTKEFKVLFHCDGGGYYYNNGFYYRREEKDNTLHIEKMDMEGNVISAADISHADANISDTSNMYFNFITENGFIITYNFYDSFGTTVREDYRIISPDLQTITTLPQKAGEHGIMQDVTNPEFIASYKNKIYSSGSYLDTDTMTWTDIDEKLTGVRGHIGKYLILSEVDGSSTRIYDMEKDEIIAQIATASKTSNFGGTYSYILKNNQWYQVQYPSDGSSINLSQYEPLGTETVSEYDYTILDDTYYLVKDDYGIFLRTYEKGEAEEETVLIFPNTEAGF